jgi:broad specificity phosphatase PhoE
VGQGHEPRPVRPILTERASNRVYLARHGQTTYNKEGRFQGQQQVPLDDLGRAQADELAEHAVAFDFAALWTSPLLRARETADAVAARTRLQPREDARLMETDAGDWTDHTFADVIAESPDLFAAFANADPDFAFPGGESFAEQELRVAEALDEIEAGELPALVVCHGMVIRAALSVRIGRWLPYGQRVPNGAIVPLEPNDEELAQIGRTPAPEAS